jgi:hypothetical protein
VLQYITTHLAVLQYITTHLALPQYMDLYRVQAGYYLITILHLLTSTLPQASAGLYITSVHVGAVLAALSVSC